MVFYGLVDLRLLEIVEFYGTREEAERAVRDVLADEPRWSDYIGLARVDFGAGRAGVSSPEVELLEA